MNVLKLTVLSLLIAALIMSSCAPSPDSIAIETQAATTIASGTSPAQATDPPPAEPSEKPTAQPTPVATPRGQQVKLTVVYDSNPCDPQLTSLWGFSCLVQYGAHTMLFDTGGDSPTLLANMEKLGLDPAVIDIVILSHEHGDHIGGLEGLLQVNSDLTVYAPVCFAEQIRSQVESAGARLVVIDAPLEIVPGVLSTGEISGPVDEQALALESPLGLVVVTGCAHPGIVPLVSASAEAAGVDPFLIVGGFHLGNASPTSVKRIVAELQQLGVQKAAPTHCTGDAARALFAEGYGQDYLEVGVGWSMTVGG